MIFAWWLLAFVPVFGAGMLFGRWARFEAGKTEGAP